jgi:hypothetical protein
MYVLEKDTQVKSIQKIICENLRVSGRKLFSSSKETEVVHRDCSNSSAPAVTPETRDIGNVTNNACAFAAVPVTSKYGRGQAVRERKKQRGRGRGSGRGYRRGRASERENRFGRLST